MSFPTRNLCGCYRWDAPGSNAWCMRLQPPLARLWGDHWRRRLGFCHPHDRPGSPGRAYPRSRPHHPTLRPALRDSATPMYEPRPRVIRQWVQTLRDGTRLPFHRPGGLLAWTGLLIQPSVRRERSPTIPCLATRRIERRMIRMPPVLVLCPTYRERETCSSLRPASDYLCGGSWPDTCDGSWSR